MNTATYSKASQAILSRHHNAYDIVQHDEQSFSARVGGAIAYYVIIDGVIVGDVWFE
jgi:hypothetical protein